MLTGYSNIISVTTDCFTGLLDLYPNAAVAYSVRKLRSAYAGAAIRVRRSSDNAEQDIGFTGAGDLNESALTTFVGAGNGFVVTWYDQSGNANNATQSNPLSQSKIANAGVIYKTNGKPSILFDGVDDFYTLNTTIFPNPNGNYQSFVSKRDFVSNRIFFLAGNRYFAGTWSDNLSYLFAKSNTYINSTTSYSLANQNLFTGLLNNAGNQEIYIDGNIITTSASSFPYNCVLNTIGNYLVGTAYTNGYLQESVYYDFDQTSNKSGIESNVNTYYAIY